MRTYQSLWAALGKVIKEGLYEDQDNKEKILDISLFKSTKKNELVTLQEYVDQFAEGQDVIYYLSTENAELALNSPHLESFEAKGIDVLLLSDPIDDFWLTNMPNFKGKSFQSITRGEIDLSKIASRQRMKAMLSQYLMTVLLQKSNMRLRVKWLMSEVQRIWRKVLARLVADQNGMTHKWNG